MDNTFWIFLKIVTTGFVAVAGGIFLFLFLTSVESDLVYYSATPTEAYVERFEKTTGIYLPKDTGVKEVRSQNFFMYDDENISMTLHTNCKTSELRAALGEEASKTVYASDKNTGCYITVSCEGSKIKITGSAKSINSIIGNPALTDGREVSGRYLIVESLCVLLYFGLLVFIWLPHDSFLSKIH